MDKQTVARWGGELLSILAIFGAVLTGITLVFLGMQTGDWPAIVLGIGTMISGPFIIGEVLDDD